ncbi:hypothetical protein O181_030571 [Austropuccinia psidii MF-1]|uniref:Uncharacterized protein n=1 Tax=Austropuccinia psidii MF-1 TaxID=1389203 RepID=A0A9Q3H4D6_9BASI|nr:hypothetical protein [Austropuccinia psidii MF-1]
MVNKDLDIASTNKASKEVDFEMDHNTYIQILSSLQITTPDLCDYSKLPHPEGANVFLSYAKERYTIITKVYLIGKPEPNNIIQYNSPHQVVFGTVLHILSVIKEVSKDELLVVKHLDIAKRKWKGERWLKEVFDSLSVVHLKQSGPV